MAQLFLHVFLGLTLTGKKASKRTVLHNRLNKEKKIWLLAAMVIMMYYWRFWEPWANAMLAIPACLPGSHPYWTQKSFKTNSFAAMMIMMYYWRFWEPWANAMLAILLPKLWFGLKIMTGTTVFACLPGAHPYWTQKSFKTNSFT